MKEFRPLHIQPAASLFGVTRNAPLLKARCKGRLGLSVQTQDFGPEGTLFFHLGSGDVATNDIQRVLKVGAVRGPDELSLSAHDLSVSGALTPHAIDVERLCGNGLVACLSRTAPTWCAYMTLMSTPQLYYAALPDDGVVCATSIRPLLALLNQVQLDESVLPAHVMFRLVPGEKTYYRGVRRLFPGQVLSWHNRSLSVRVAKRLGPYPDSRTLRRADDAAVEALYHKYSTVMEAYVTSIAGAGGAPATLLSGGVDSTLIQLLLNDLAIQRPKRTFSFSVEAEAFSFELDYARAAVQSLGTEHTTLPISARDYGSLLVRSLELRAQPNLFNESAPCNVALAELIGRDHSTFRHCFAGYAADAQNGIGDAFAVRLYEALRGVSLAGWALQGLAGLLTRTRWSETLRASAHMLAARTTPFARYLPMSHVANDVTVLDWARRCFTEGELMQTFEHRQQLVQDHAHSRSLMEDVHVLDLLTAGYDFAVAVSELYAAHSVILLQFYLDESVIRSLMSFDSDIRFVERGRLKPLQRKMLARKGLTKLDWQRKGGGNFEDNLYAWMRTGELRDITAAMERPGFLAKSAFDSLRQSPDRFLWPLVTYDVLQKVMTREGTAEMSISSAVQS